jgi:ABC-type polysaccharide/polyol phosphate transport system ATPase subunit
MTQTPAIVVEQVSKLYLLYRSPAQRFFDLMLGRASHAQRFTALDGVSLRVERGETLGLIGRNGAGKSTLLSTISGVLTPSAGSVRVDGRLGALLELGAGFHPDYTGRENVYMAASLLGLSRDEIERRFDAVASFAAIGAHLDQPVRTYSSGMFVRLAFAVHTALEPDVLIIDEALAVGDAAFQVKCFRRLRELKERGTAIVLVTHDTQSVRMFCDRVIWLENGRVQMEGDPARVCAEYLRALHAGDEPQPGPDAKAIAASSLPATRPQAYAFEAELAETAATDTVVRWGKGGARLLWAGLTGADPGAGALNHGERLLLSVLFRCEDPSAAADLSVAFTVLHRKSLELVYESTSAQGLKLDASASGRETRVDFEFENILAADEYTVALALWQDRNGRPEYLDFVSGVLPFKVVSETVVHGLVRPAARIRLA